MAVPKRKTYRARRDKRRSNWKTKAPSLAVCSHCAHPVVPHRVCENCGYYAGVEIMEPKE